MPKSIHRPVPAASLAENMERLNSKRQEILRPVLEHPRDYVLLSVRALAKKLNSDPATIIRIVRGLGFENYKQFQRHLHELSIAFATSMDTMRKGLPSAANPSPCANSILHDLKNLEGLQNSIDPSRCKALAKRLYAARRVHIFGGDLAAVLADYFGYHLNLLALPVTVSTSPGGIAHSARSVTKQDLVFGISFRRGLRQTVEGIEIARERGGHCVGITDTYLSPIASISHECFLATIDCVSFGASYTTPIALLNGILATIGDFRRQRTMTIVRELDEEQRKGSRWYNP